MDLVSEGVGALQMQDLQRAHTCLRQALALQPAHPDACHLLAVVLIHADGSLDEAEALIRVALNVKPGEPVFWNSLGTVAWQKGDVPAAVGFFEKALELRPEYVDAVYNAGNAYRELREYDKALQAYQTTITLDPSYVNAYNDMGLVYHLMGRYDDAVDQYLLALELDPIRDDIYLNLANSYQSLGDFEDASMAIQNALAIAPGNSKAYNNLGTLHHEQENYREAEDAFREALALDPNSYQAAYNLGLVFHELGEYKSSADMFDTAISHIREWPSALVNKGNALYKLNRFDEAIESYKQAIAFYPRYAAAHLNLASTYRRMCLLSKAVESFDRAIALRPDNASAHFGKALVLLKAGDMQAGWRHYEWRFEVTDNHFNSHPDLRHPEWRGQDITDKTLMVIGEQGLGDIIHFVRYLKLLRGNCRRIVLACAPSLIPLLRAADLVDEFVDRSRPWSVTCDYYIHLLSLPHIFNTTVENIPADVPYLFANKEKIDYWRNKLHRGRINVGLVWCGNPDQAENEHRSCPLRLLNPLGELQGVAYYSLQKGAGAEQLRNGETTLDLIDFTEELADFADTAALVRALDLVITIDTSVAHLAGAVNAPVWTMLWYAHCWRYLQNRDDSPWYPSMRLFRQPSIGDWPSVVERVKQELAAYCRSEIAG